MREDQPAPNTELAELLLVLDEQISRLYHNTEQHHKNLPLTDAKGEPEQTYPSDSRVKAQVRASIKRLEALNNLLNDTNF